MWYTKHHIPENVNIFLRGQSLLENVRMTQSGRSRGNQTTAVAVAEEFSERDAQGGAEAGGADGTEAQRRLLQATGLCNLLLT
jgi:hypothetical protein